MLLVVLVLVLGVVRVVLATTAGLGLLVREAAELRHVALGAVVARLEAVALGELSLLSCGTGGVVAIKKWQSKEEGDSPAACADYTRYKPLAAARAGGIGDHVWLGHSRGS